MRAVPMKVMIFGMALLLLSSTGCGCAGFNVSVKLDPSVQNPDGTYPPVEVHLVGVSPSEYQRWHDMSMSEYWAEPKITEEILVMKLGSARGTTGSISDKDPMWKTWEQRGAIPRGHLFVLSLYPASKDLPGDADLRRLILPMDCQKWPGYSWGRNEIPLLVKADPFGVITLRQPKR